MVRDQNTRCLTYGKHYFYLFGNFDTRNQKSFPSVRGTTIRQDIVTLATNLLWSKYQFGNPKLFIFTITNNNYRINVLFEFEIKITAGHSFFRSWRQNVTKPSSSWTLTRSSTRSVSSTSGRKLLLFNGLQMKIRSERTPHSHSHLLVDSYPTHQHLPGQC